MAEYLGLVELGTLLKDGIEQPRPTRPWHNDDEPYPGAGRGNMADYGTLQDMSKWVLGATSADPANRLFWHKIKDGDKTLLVCDRNILTRVGWGALNSSGLVTGAPVMIDGRRFICRVLTGGNEKREGGTGVGHTGGVRPNEWDAYIANEANIAGLPTPTASDLDNTLAAADSTSQHNQTWNWLGTFSWMQEVYTHNNTYRVYRGHFGPKYWHISLTNSARGNTAWRPVLEVLNNPPIISGEDSDLGVVSELPLLTYQVIDLDAGKVAVTEALNGQTICYTSEVSQGEDIAFALSGENWHQLPLGEYVATITADDGRGGVATRTYTFVRYFTDVEFELEDTGQFMTSVPARRIVFTGQYNQPVGSLLTIMACNNRYDDNPAWEDITEAVAEHRAHVFANKSSAAWVWGVNVRVKHSKGSATEPLEWRGFGIRFD